MDGNTHYRVSWQIDIYAGTPVEAARKAQQILDIGGVFWAFGIDEVKTGKSTKIDLRDWEDYVVLSEGKENAG